jgi:hypothetical protein
MTYPPRGELLTKQIKDKKEHIKEEPGLAT